MQPRLPAVSRIRTCWNLIMPLLFALTASALAAVPASAHSSHPGSLNVEGCRVDMKTPLHQPNNRGLISAEARVNVDGRCAVRKQLVTVYLAISHFRNGRYTDWTAHQINGQGWQLNEVNYPAWSRPVPVDGPFGCKVPVSGVTRVRYATAVRIGPKLHEGQLHRSDQTITVTC
jgi:hypothetical protein